MLTALAFAAAGLVFGSFLTVVVHRVPRGLSVVSPRSSCPGCGATIRARENIPVVSYLIQRRRCRHCGIRISPEYPVVEASTGALFAAAALVLPTVWMSAVVAPFLGLLVACALIDLRHRVIPNRVVYPSLVVFGAAIAAGGAFSSGVSPVTGLLGFLAYGGGLFLTALISPRGMGMGDVKLAALIGLVLGALGWRYVGVAVLVTVLGGGVFAVALLAAGRTRKQTIPFGPFLAAGAIVSALIAPEFASWYLATGL
jgi:leader peptidase (prepilin peptidase)/N-methyltransferase